MSFLRRWLNGGERLPTAETDLEAGLGGPSASSGRRVAPEGGVSSPTPSIATSVSDVGSQASVIELSALPSSQGDAVVIVMSPSAAPGHAQQSASPGDDLPNARELIGRRLVYIRRVAQIMIFLTVLQIMSTLGVEPIHFLSLFALFVPWTGYEGAKELNPAFIRVFYWGCWIMIPANFFHYMSFNELVDQVLESTVVRGTVEENARRELMFNRTLFNVVTIIIVLLMSISLAWVRQINTLVTIARMTGDTDTFIIGARTSGASHASRMQSGPLSSEEISAIPAVKLSAEDLANGGGDKEVCVICQDEYQVNDLAKRLNCRHMFHASCIDSWLERSSTCPICNGDVRSIV